MYAATLCAPAAITEPTIALGIPRNEGLAVSGQRQGDFVRNGRGERIRTSGLYVPNVALYQAKLHPDKLDNE